MRNSIFTPDPFFIRAFAFPTYQTFLKFTRNILNYFIFYFFKSRLNIGPPPPDVYFFVNQSKLSLFAYKYITQIR